MYVSMVFFTYFYHVKNRVAIFTTALSLSLSLSSPLSSSISLFPFPLTECRFFFLFPFSYPKNFFILYFSLNIQKAQNPWVPPPPLVLFFLFFHFLPERRKRQWRKRTRGRPTRIREGGVERSKSA